MNNSGTPTHVHVESVQPNEHRGPRLDVKDSRAGKAVVNAVKLSAQEELVRLDVKAVSASVRSGVEAKYIPLHIGTSPAGALSRVVVRRL